MEGGTERNVNLEGREGSMVIYLFIISQQEIE